MVRKGRKERVHVMSLWLRMQLALQMLVVSVDACNLPAIEISKPLCDSWSMAPY